MPSTRNLRHLNLCFPNFTPESESPPTSPTATTDTPSPHHNYPPCPSSPSIMIKNFNSLYDPTFTCSSSLSTTLSFEPEPEPADLASAFASQRFFFSSPGRSNSLIRDTNTNTNTDNCTQQHSSPSSSSSSLKATTPEDHKPDGDGDEKKQKKKKKRVLFFKGSMAVATYSPDPYQDFRRSMQEMVEARPELMDVKSNWNVLHELLLCYLALNPKSTHKFILGAFADLLVTLMSF